MSEYIIDISHEPLSAWNPKGEIIRCRDCEYYASNMHECMRLYEWDDSLWFAVEPDDFCSFGERRER